MLTSTVPSGNLICFLFCQMSRFSVLIYIFDHENICTTDWFDNHILAAICFFLISGFYNNAVCCSVDVGLSTYAEAFEQQPTNNWRGVFSVSSYTQYFNVDTDIVINRMISSMHPVAGDFFNKIDANPDLWVVLSYPCASILSGVSEPN